MEAATKVTMPSFVMPWESGGRNPAESRAAERLWTWAETCGLAADDCARQLLRSSKPEAIASLLFPAAQCDELTLAAQWLAVNFLVDDALDAENDPGRCSAVVAKLMRNLEDPEACTTGILAPALVDLWRTTRRGRSWAWRQSFLNDVRDWLLSYVVESMERKSRQRLEIESYCVHRRASTGMLVLVDLVESSLGVDLPPEFRRHEVMVQLRAAISEHMGLINDLHSVFKEQSANQIHNAVSIIQDQEGRSMQESVNLVNDMATDRLRLFEASAKKLPNTPEFQRCLQGYRLLMRGAFDCYAVIGRYAVPPEHGVAT